MLRAASSAPNRLRDAAGRVRTFVESRLAGDGGFTGRSGASDLYYTVFGTECLLALGAEPPEALADYLSRLGDGQSLDFVHQVCLARCWAALPADVLPEATRAGLLDRIQQARCEDGGFSHVADARHGSTYGCFLTIAAHQDLRAELPDPEAVAGCIESMELGDGSFANDRRLGIGSTAATAAAVTALRHLARPADHTSADWLLEQCGPDGGFVAAPGMLSGDLLSTAIALHALAGSDVPLDEIREHCLDFLDGLWDDAGAFHGYRGDDVLDCEYAYYGLLAMGHLSE